MRYLKDPHTPLVQVAFMLGYTEQSTFHNAFNRWTGTTPIAFRESAHGIVQQRG
ncbi:MAG: helix-turn-helix domain-containing protein [Gammaproteobacteria bacterium]|nr:helix-turn-helix domain-containing protein [Gammaproteobacteria bacterium]